MMKIYDSSTDSFLKATGLEHLQAPVISIVGAGGKTSLIESLTEEYAFRKIRHGIFTTTHMWPVNDGNFRHILGVVTASGKIGMPEEEDIRELMTEKIPVLIEADGSRGLPCKAPEMWEPVLRPETTHVIGVLGASCLGGSVIESCHRPERVMDILKCGPEHRITAEDLVEIGSSRKGLRKNVKGSQWYGLVINQVDNDFIYHEIQYIRKQLRQKGVEQLFFVRIKNK